MRRVDGAKVTRLTLGDLVLCLKGQRRAPRLDTARPELRDENLKAAYERVVSNGGAGGVDGRSVDDLKGQLRTDWPRIREQVLGGSYEPSPVRKVEIPKPGGGKRTLGIPTVMDRMIQQALHQALTPIFDG